MELDSKDLVALVRKDLESRNKVIEEVYNDSELRSSIKNYLFKNGGRDLDVEDIFVFAIITFIKQCQRSGFELKKGIKAYLFSIAKYEWIRINKKKMKLVPEENLPELGDSVNIEHLIIEKEKGLNLRQAIEKLDSKCRDILLLWANNIRMREIAVRMSYKSEGMARKKKYECVKKLRMLI